MKTGRLACASLVGQSAETPKVKLLKASTAETGRHQDVTYTEDGFEALFVGEDLL